MNEKLCASVVLGILIGIGGMLAWESYRTPTSWEECMVDRLETARTNNALSLLNRYCGIYPARK